MSGVEVTVRDPQTGQSETTVIEDDYVLIVAGTCYRSYVQVSGNGSTHTITVKGRKP